MRLSMPNGPSGAAFEVAPVAGDHDSAAVITAAD
jgi:hypothetical protein